MLPLFAMLLFALLGIGALVVDGGLALTEQARLDAAAEMLAREWVHTTALPDAALPERCRSLTQGTDARERCLRATRLGPLLGPLGLVLDPQGGAPDARPLSLEGIPVDLRGVRLGTLETAGVLAADAGAQLRLSRSTPLLLGWGALLPRVEGRENAEIPDVLAARQREGMTPDLAGSGLRSAGFEVEGRASIDALGLPALRVGPILPDRPGVAGAVGLALHLSALDALATALVDGAGTPTLDLSAILEQGQTLVRARGDEVGCSFDLSVSGRRVGERLIRRAELAFDPARPVATAYLPIVESCEEPVLGFVELALRPGATPGEIGLVRATAGSAQPNASAIPDSREAARAAAAVIGATGTGGQALLVDPDASWAPLVLRRARLSPTPPTGASR